jgi:branched-chain amino acid transport system permease protein
MSSTGRAPAALSRRRRGAALLAMALLLVLLGGTSVSAQDDPDATTTDDSSEALFGTLRFEGEPVEGAVITVVDEGGTSVGQATSAGDGTWRFVLPGPGLYEATIDIGSFPEGVTLRDADRATLGIDVTAGRERPLNFGLGERVDTAPSKGEQLAQAMLNGVKLGLIIAMGAVGLSLIFGTTGLINFAHGELVTFGAVVAWYFNARGPELNLILAAIAAMIVTGAVGGALELAMFRPLRRRRLGAFQFVALTIGLSLLARHLILIWYDAQPQPYRDYVIQDEWEFGPFALTPRDATIMIISAIVLALVGLMLTRTRMGKAMRAVSDSVDLAESSGIDVNRVTLSVWIVGAGLAALGGVFMGAVEAVDWQMGFRLLLLLFAAVVLGGLGTAFGAVVGGIVIGVITETSTVWVQPEIKSVFALIALILVLLVRPQGILGVKGRIG